ncbi:hypothetical protein PspLS_07189 [Pyricularia sp. CBS 133598]|nr:hypothetical protein PspLS_07189 [Pyricularia sp. CBS 133598]
MADQISSPTKAAPSAPAPPSKATAAIPVGLNEAALDSPSFRAAAIHFGDQVDAIKRWLESYSRAASRLAQDVASLEESINSYLANASPAPGTADGVIDTDFTLLALKRVGELSRERWTKILTSARNIDAMSTDPIRSFLNSELNAFNKAKRELESSQRGFDAVLARHVAQSKTKEPSALREDAFALYETRKTYLKASMDFCQLAPQLRYTLDKLLVKISADMWKEMKKSDPASAIAGKYSEEMDRLRGWSRDLEDSEAALKRELQAARREVSEPTLAGFKPSRELEDYSVSTVPYIGSRGPVNLRSGDNASFVSEKQGWLFTRSVPGKQNPKVMWFRRWYYCREGIFGWLVPSSQGVLQGEEIGLLLCSAKPAVQEERRFCFEVKTKTQNLMLQAETQVDLIEWLEVFEVAKKQAFEATLGRDNSSLPGGVDPAFSITQPVAPEFAAKSIDAMALDDNVGNPERSSTMTVPPNPEVGVAPRPSVDVSTMTAPRRAITSLAREEGESNREHASRLMQRLDLHRKALTSGTDQGGPQPSGGIAGLISASHNLLPANYAVVTPHLVSSRPQTAMVPTTPSRPKALAPATLARPPTATGLSKHAVVAFSEIGVGQGAGQIMPTALRANYWGSSFWGAMYCTGGDAPVPSTPSIFEDDPFGPPIKLQSPTGTVQQLRIPGSLHRKTLSESVGSDKGVLLDPAKGDTSETFPPKYPSELKPHHAQFRMLFPSVPIAEKLALVFNATWSSSSEDGSRNQTLIGGGRVYVTPDNMYFYGHHMGLVTAYKVRLDAITEVTAAPGKENDFIFLHLGQDMNAKGFTRITIKTFLEDLALLQTRINLLIDDLQAEEPMDLSTLVQTLVDLEKEDLSRKSLSMESWEEIPSHTPADDGTYAGRAPDRAVGLRHQGDKEKQMAKFVLPAHAVIYEPEDMQQLVAERHYDISAKACFHILFGDKSFIFPKLYFERRAKEISQGPWQLAEHGKMQRQFRFKVDCRDVLGRRKPADVEDTQTVEVFSDHITYVVKHVKTPWHLPHSQAFKLVTKIVITHLAKSKCKLAIYTKVDWSKVPTFSKRLVQRQAMDDVERDAEELAEVATDQVRRLGPHSRTKRAIQVYGHIGQQTQVVIFTPGEKNAAKKPQIKPRTLTHMVWETLRSFAESVASSLMMWTFAILRRLFNIFSANRIILAVLAVSVVTNLMFTSIETSTWWAERNAAKFMQRLGIGPNVMMSKAIYVYDLDQATESSFIAGVTKNPPNSKCYSTFRDILNSTDMDAPYQDAGANMSSRSSKLAARRIRRTRQRLGSYRHDLVVAMRVVNSIEREMIQTEWENWLMDENMRCEQVRVMLNDEGKDRTPYREDSQHRMTRPIDEHRVQSLREWHEEYCGSCRADHEAIFVEQKSPITLV